MTLAFEVFQSNFFLLFSAYFGFLATLWGVAHALKIARQS